MRRLRQVLSANPMPNVNRAPERLIGGKIADLENKLGASAGRSKLWMWVV